MQRGAFNELHGDIENAVLLACVKDGDDVGMAEYAGCARFILETAHHLRGVQTVDVETHGLECDGTANGGVFCFIDHAHGPATKFIENFVSADCLYRHKKGLVTFPSTKWRPCLGGLFLNKDLSPLEDSTAYPLTLARTCTEVNVPFHPRHDFSKP